MIKGLHRWTKISSAKWEDEWVERLRFLDRRCLTFFRWGNSRALKIEAYCDRATARALARRFGGEVRPLPQSAWQTPSAKARAPLSIRGKLKVFSDEETWRVWQRSGRKPPGIFIPAGMAFGTGEHATTSACLRLLADEAGKRPDGFSLLDLGTGSGILAIAGHLLGSHRTEAIDNDRAALRIARHNASINACRGIAFAESDVLDLRAKKPFDIVVANLLSGTLIVAAALLGQAVRPQGVLIFSGVLKTQMAETTRALMNAGFTRPAVVGRGKWRAGICSRRQPRDRR